MEIVKRSPNYDTMMQKYEKILETISGSSRYVRFVGVIGSKGQILAHKRRADLKPLMNSASTKYHFSQIALKNDMESFFDRNLGHVEFVWEERKKVQTIAFGIKKNTIWVSIDRKVVRTEVLRIIDTCLRLVREYS